MPQPPKGSAAPERITGTIHDPRHRRPDLDLLERWYQDRGVIGTLLWFLGFGSIVFGILFASQVYQFIHGVDLENRYGRCGVDAPENCATVTEATVLSVHGQTLKVQEAGVQYEIVRASGAPLSGYRVGERIQVLAAGGPVGEVKKADGSDWVFTRFYQAQNPFYWQWQGTAFGLLFGSWLVVYVWGVKRAGVRSPRDILAERRRQ